jgi:hypothetical protein
MDLFPGAPRFNNIKPRTRAEREGLRDREAIEKVRLKERVGGFHRYEEFNGVGAVEEKSTLHMPESERFASDFAAEDRQRREADYQRRQEYLNGHRQEVIGREVNRWQGMEDEEARKQQYLGSMAAKWKQGQKNNPSAAYNPITLEYDTTEQGTMLKQADDAVRYRAGLRLFNLDQRMNSGYNVLTGEARRPPNLPPQYPEQ